MLAKGKQHLFRKNRSRLADEIQENELVVVFSARRMPRNGDQFFPFRQDSNFFHLTGIEQPDSILLLNTSEAVLFITEPSHHTSLWEGSQLSAEEASRRSGIDAVRWVDDFEQTIDRFLGHSDTVCFNVPEKLTAGGVMTKDAEYLDRFRSTYPFHRTRSLKPLMEKIRLRKEPEELEYIREAIRITGRAFKRVLSNLQPGNSEKEVEAEITHELINQGARGFAFDPIVAAGANATTLHYTSNRDTCRDNELLLMDFGAEYMNYAADITRTVPVNGRFTQRQKACYQAVLDVMQEHMDQVRPGTTIGTLNRIVAGALREKHHELGLYTPDDLEEDPQIWKRYFPHGVSHFMGLDVHDAGGKDTVLEKGMVISWEPGIYIPEENIGIRIEDDILVDDDPINLSENIPKDPGVIESLMHQKEKS
jgi:Xaa-Pro aminopeptidase